MCGRFTLATAPEVLAEHFDLDEIPDLRPRYNIAPTQNVPAVRLIIEDGQRRQRRQRRLHLLRWGLIPSWAKDRSIGNRMINARSETAADKPSFCRALRRRRCLVVADGFYEWQRQGRARQPYLIRMRDRRPFGIAGLWEQWVSPDGEAIESCTLLTTTPNELVGQIHDRMPVILHPKDYDLWLDPQTQDPAALKDLLRPCPADVLEAFPVSTRVNSPALDDPGCIEPLD
jgi:putative SOS response-associated peptidase YedK